MRRGDRGEGERQIVRALLFDEDLWVCVGVVLVLVLASVAAVSACMGERFRWRFLRFLDLVCVCVSVCAWTWGPGCRGESGWGESPLRAADMERWYSSVAVAVLCCPAALLYCATRPESSAQTRHETETAVGALKIDKTKLEKRRELSYTGSLLYTASSSRLRWTLPPAPADATVRRRVSGGVCERAATPSSTRCASATVPPTPK